MKKFFTYFSLAIILVVGIYGAIYMAGLPRTYDGKGVDLVELYNNPYDYNTDDADGVASIMVKENLDKTRTVNAVTSIVFDYRGYDTLGESFILLTAISGSMAILRKSKNRRAVKDEEKH